MRKESENHSDGIEREKDDLPVNIRQALALAASIIRRMSHARLAKGERNGLISGVRNTYGERRNEKGK